MLPYYLLTGASLAGGALPLQRLKYRWGYLLTMGLACWLLASLRYVTGFDYRFYESAFQSIAVNGLEGADWSEPGYLLLNLAVSLLWNDYRGFLFVFHFLLTALVFVWIGRYSPSPWLSVFLFFTLQYFALSMNFLRQALATAARAPCRLVSSKVRTGLLITGALAYFLFAASQGFHGVYPYHGIWERALTP